MYDLERRTAAGWKAMLAARGHLVLVAWVVLATLLLLLPFGAGAQNVSAPKSPAAALADTAYAPVRLEGRKLFEVMGSGPLAAAQRADRIQRRLQNLIARDEPVRPFNEQDVRPQADGSYLVTLGGEAVMSVTPADAQDSLASPNELALLWGQKMAGAVVEARETRENPLRGAGILIRNSFRDLIRSILEWLPRLAGALVLWLLFWLLAKVGSWIVRLIGERTRLDANLRQLARAVSYYGIWAVGVVAILSTLGFESGGIVTALGVSGFILGFAFKDILSHFLAGLLLLVGRQFRIGDQIVVKEFEGTVERIELRALHLRTYDNRLVILPNGDVFTSAVVSNTASPHRRRDFLVGIGYDDNIGQAVRVALETVQATPGVLADPAPDVLVDELAASTINLRVRFFMNSLRADYLRVGSDCMRRVKEAFDREGISMPTEIQTIFIQNLEELRRTRPRPAASGENGRNTEDVEPAGKRQGVQ